MAISNDVRQRVWSAAGSRCGYCLASQVLAWGTLEIDHLQPQSLGGDDAEENLWLACGRCNKHKASRTTVTDPETGLKTNLFNPRTADWFEHFRWIDGGVRLLGITPIGRATVAALKLNDTKAVRTRAVWVRFGLHPPNN